MLQVHYGSLPEEIYNTSVYFKNTYLEEWLQDDFARKMIKSVDRSEVVGDRLIISKALGMISPTDLSGGVKTLLLVYNEPEKIFNASTCGDNCAYWLLRLAYKREREYRDGDSGTRCGSDSNPDITVCLHHLMDFGNGKFTIRVSNTGDVVHSMRELAPIAASCLNAEFADIDEYWYNRENDSETGNEVVR